MKIKVSKLLTKNELFSNKGATTDRFVDEVRIEECTQTPCYVFQGSDVVMEVDFRSVAAQSLRPQVFATALGQTIEYTLPPAHQNACNHLSRGSCPVSQDEDITYRFVFPITNIYPPIPVTVQLTLFNQDNQPVFCKITDIIVRLR